MTLSSTRGLSRTSLNPGCEVQAAMVVERVREPDFYRQLTGHDFPGEYGERVAARRRGAKFESDLYQNDAARLRAVLGPLYGLDPSTMVVRNFALEAPGPREGPRAIRLHRTRNILRDLAAGRAVPDLLIQPQMRLSLDPGGTYVEYISPDVLVLDPSQRVYVPGELKSFIVRDGVADGADLDPTRRQAAAQIVALRFELDALGIATRVTDRAAFVFATPFGLAPAPAFEEGLAAEVHEMERAIQVLLRVRARLVELRAGGMVVLRDLVDDLDINYQDSCLTSCVLATVCSERYSGMTGALGNSARHLLGQEVGLDRLAALIQGAPTTSALEAELARSLQHAVAAIGFESSTLRRRTA